jgi:hypothetical protein
MKADPGTGGVARIDFGAFHDTIPLKTIDRSQAAVAAAAQSGDAMLHGDDDDAAVTAAVCF